MKHLLLSARMGLVAGVIAVTGLLALPAIAAAQADRGSSGGGGGGGAATGGTSGAASAGGGADRGGGGGGGFVGGSSGRDSGGNRGGPTGGSGMAMPRAGSGDHSGAGSTPRYAGGPAAKTTGRAEESGGEKSGVPQHSRPRDPNTPSQGTAVPRPPNSVPTRGGTGISYIVPGGYYGAYGFGYGYGYGGLYGGYYDPWYDPWYGAYPGYSGGSQTTYNDEGGLRLKIKPKNAEVYVDGYFTGTVDEFDGMFQKLHLDSGVHRIEVRAAGFETLTFEVRISADHTTTYQGEMRRIQ